MGLKSDCRQLQTDYQGLRRVGETGLAGLLIPCIQIRSRCHCKVERLPSVWRFVFFKLIAAYVSSGF
jgi:hypothetical protein